MTELDEKALEAAKAAYWAAPGGDGNAMPLIEGLMAYLSAAREPGPVETPTREEIADELQAMMHALNSVPEEPRRPWSAVPEFERDDWRGLADYVLSLLSRPQPAPSDAGAVVWTRELAAKMEEPLDLYWQRSAQERAESLYEAGLAVGLDKLGGAPTVVVDIALAKRVWNEFRRRRCARCRCPRQPFDLALAFIHMRAHAWRDNDERWKTSWRRSARAAS